MRVIALLWPLATLSVLGCVYVESEPSEAEAGSSGQAEDATESPGAAGATAASTTLTAGQQACRAVCGATTQSNCVEATTDLAACTANCEAALAGSCGLAFSDYLLCAEAGGEVVCPYGPVIHGCEDSFFVFLDCAGLEPS